MEVAWREGKKTSRDLLILVQRFLFLWETKVGLMMPSLKMKVSTKLTFCTTVLDELNWAKMASTATLTELTRAVWQKQIQLQLFYFFKNWKIKINKKQLFFIIMRYTILYYFSFLAGMQKTALQHSVRSSHHLPSRPCSSAQSRQMRSCEQLLGGKDSRVGLETRLTEDNVLQLILSQPVQYMTAVCEEHV